MADFLDTLLQGTWNADVGGIQFFLWLTLATLIYSGNLEKRKKWGLRAGISIIAISILAALIPPYQMSSNLGTLCWFLAMYFINAAVVYSYCQVTILEAFSCASYGSLTEHIASSIYVILLALDYTSNFTYTIISSLVYAAAWLVVGRKMTSDGHFRTLGFRKLLTTLMTVMVVTVLSYLCKVEAGLFTLPGIESEGMRRMLLYSQGYSIAFCLTMLAVEYHSEMGIRMQNQLAAGHELLRLREKEFRLTKENIDLINRKCHDMKHQVSLLMDQDDKKTELRERYGREIMESIEIYDSNIHTGNEVLDIVLMDKSLYCSMHGIVWTCMAQGEILNFVEDMDLAALMGNALDNAVEAVERIEDPKKRFIGVQIGQKEQFAQIRVENSYDGKLKVSGDRILTGKRDRDYHGFGISSIRATAEKYGGYASVITENNTFVLSILIPLNRH